MTPAEIAERLAALNWSSTSTTHQLAVSAAVEALKGLVPATGVPRAKPSRAVYMRGHRKKERELIRAGRRLSEQREGKK
jgi:hypothetical protein